METLMTHIWNIVYLTQQVINIRFQKVRKTENIVLNIFPPPLKDVFTVNNTHHNYDTRQTNDLHVNSSQRENTYRLLVYVAHIFGTISPPHKFLYMYHISAIQIYIRITF